MGFRYRRSYKVFPGVKVNIGKKSTSFTIGGKLYHTTLNKKRGTVTRTVSTPIKGLSYTETERIPKNGSRGAQAPMEYSPRAYKAFALVMAAVGVAAVALGIVCLVFQLVGYGIGMLVLAAVSAYFAREWMKKAKSKEEDNGQ